MVPVPSLFFIGENGTPLEIVAGSMTTVELVSKIDSVLTKAGKSSKQSSLNLIDAEQKATAISSSSNNNTIENATASNINDNNSNPNIDLALNVMESVIADSTSDNKDVIENAAKTTLLNTENQDNNEASKKNIEAEQASQNKELSAEVCKLLNCYLNIIFDIIVEHINYICCTFLGEARKSTTINRASTKTTIRGGTEKRTGTRN